ncbi:hypothetical protein CN918_28920 [Priestia megaterium]|nr:hypothetical protein CN918_28920 [Priestia megaterium]
MKEKRNVIKWVVISAVILIFLVPAGFIYVLNNGNPYTKYLANKYIPEHLEEQGYKKSDMKVSSYGEPSYLINQKYYHGHYMVIFKDQPKMTYYYGLSKRGKKVVQFCEKDVLRKDGVTDGTEKKTKHSEQKCDYAFKNRSFN